jgi:hypothetical protein
MVKLRKDEVADLDVAALDAVEYSESDFDSYSGRIPDDNTELYGYVAAMWWCRTAEKDDGTGLDPMIKVLWIAADNDGDLAEFNGLPVVENLVLVPGAKFRWAPFLNVFGITLKAIKTATYVAEEDDERWGGAPIEKIGTFVPGQDNDAAWSRVLTKKRFWNERWTAEAKKWLPWETADGDETEDVEDSADEEIADEETADEEYDDTEAEEYEDEETEDEEPEDEEEVEPEPPARGRRPAKPAAPARAARSTRTAAKPAAAKPAGSRGRGKSAAAASSSRGRKPAASGRPARGKGRAPADNEPPF